MYLTITKIRVRYAETDQMGFVYYGNYASYFEVARTEMMRGMGVSYKDMETRGCMMPMVDMSIRYLKPARYDDVLRIVTMLHKMPNTRMTFQYEIYNDDTNQLLNVGDTTLAFINSITYKPMRAPQWFLELIKSKADEMQVELEK